MRVQGGGGSDARPIPFGNSAKQCHAGREWRGAKGDCSRGERRSAGDRSHPGRGGKTIDGGGLSQRGAAIHFVSCCVVLGVGVARRAVVCWCSVGVSFG